MNSEGDTIRFRYRWAILFTSLYVFTVYAFVLQIVPPLIQPIIKEFNISNTQAGLLMSIVMVPGIFLSLPAGLFLGRYDCRKMCLLSTIFVFLGSLLTAVANSFIIVLIGRFVLGVGGALVSTALPPIIAQWFPDHELGKAMGIFGINMPLATVIAFPSAGLLSLSYGWRFPFYVGFAIGIIATISFVLIIKKGPFAQRRRVANIRTAAGNFEVWKIGLVWLCFSAAALSFSTWAPTLLEKFRNMPSVEAVLLVSLTSWAPIFFVPLYGYLSDRTHRRKLFPLVGSILMALAFVVLAYTSNIVLVITIFVLGAVTAMIPPIVSTLPAEILGPSLASIGFGVTVTCQNIGAAFAQPLIGFIIDSTQSYTFCLLAMSFFSAIGAIITYTLKTK